MANESCWMLITYRLLFINIINTKNINIINTKMSMCINNNNNNIKRFDLLNIGHFQCT